jgi:hypothetical protein
VDKNKENIQSTDVAVSSFTDVAKQRAKCQKDDASLTATHDKFQEDMKKRLEELRGLDAGERAPVNDEFLKEEKEKLEQEFAARSKKLEDNVQEYSIGFVFLFFKEGERERRRGGEEKWRRDTYSLYSSYCKAAAEYRDWTNQKTKEVDDSTPTRSLLF